MENKIIIIIIIITIFIIIKRVNSLTTENQRLQESLQTQHEIYEELQDEHKRLKSQYNMIRDQTRTSQSYIERVSQDHHNHSAIVSAEGKRSPPVLPVRKRSSASGGMNTLSLADELELELQQRRPEQKKSPLESEIGFEYFTMIQVCIRQQHEDLCNYALEYDDSMALFAYVLKHKIPIHLWEELLLWSMKSYRNMKMNLVTPHNRARKVQRSRVGTRDLGR